MVRRRLLRLIRLLRRRLWRRLRPDLLSEPALAVVLAGAICANFAIPCTSPCGRFALPPLLWRPDIRQVLQGDERSLIAGEPVRPRPRVGPDTEG